MAAMRTAILVPVVAAMLAGCEYRVPAKAKPRPAASKPAATPAPAAAPPPAPAATPAATPEAARKPSPLGAIASDTRQPRQAVEPAAAILWRVVSVHDGDTLAALDADKVQHKVRLAGIDAPEVGQPFGTKAREGLAAMTMGKAVAVHVTDRDRYGRTVARIEVEGQDVNKAMVAGGMAWHFTRYSDDAGLAAAEVEARDARRGLWGGKAPVPPWEWRAREKERKRKPEAARP